MGAIMQGISIFVCLQYGFIGLMIFLDALVYWAAGSLYALFVGLSQVTILTNEAYQQLADRIYILVGIVGLFVLTFTLLKTMVDPDKAGQEIVKSFKSLIISVALVILLPTIFKYAFSFQNAIIKDGVIHNLFNFRIDGKSKGDDKTIDEVCSVEGTTYEVLDENGNKITEESTNAKNNVMRSVNEAKCEGNYVLLNLFSAFFIPKKEGADPVNMWKTKWSDAKVHIARTGNFLYITTFVNNLVDLTSDNGVWYIFILSTAAGLFAAYVLFSFCIDLGVRAFKLAFYQIIAPIPIFLRIIPGKDSYFSKWMSATVKCFLEIFIRILLIEFMIFMVTNFWPVIKLAFSGNSQVGLLGGAILILGLFSFIKQAPKLFQEALGFEGTGVKLGVKGKLEENLPLAAGAAVGAGITTATRSIVSGVADTKTAIKAVGDGTDQASRNARNKALFGGILKTGASAITGGVGGAVAGAQAGREAKDFKGMAQAATAGADKISTDRKSRAKHIAQSGGVFKAFGENIKGKVGDVKTWAGVPNVVDRVKFEEEWVNAYDPFKNIYDNGEYQALTSKIDSYKASKGSIAEMRNLGFKVDEERMRKDGATEEEIKAAYQAKVDEAIQDLYGSQQELRKTAIRKNNAAAANSLLDLANLLKTNPSMAHELGLDNHLKMDEANKITLVGDKVMYDAGNGRKLDLTKKIDLDHMSDDDKEIINILEHIYEDTGPGQNGVGREGLFADRKKANDTKKNEMSSGEYRQYQRRQEESKK